eukprot:s2383_g7.t1
MCIHVHIDTVGRFLETDEFYRNQFETGTSCGALDDGNIIRKGWEKELFGDEVMNDYRGVLSAYQYGDSYLVLKDVRLRTTFAATDSGGIAGSRLAVLDKYAHVLEEYNETELSELIEVAVANTSMSDTGGLPPKMLRGMSADCGSEWITVGFPDLPQKKGCYYFEVELNRGCMAPQVGFLSSKFVIAPKTAGYSGGVGDDDDGWAVDGQHALRSLAFVIVASWWHSGKKIPWNRYWPSAANNPKQLERDVVVGLAIDIDARMIWVASDGEWDDEKTPTFGPDLIPKGQSLYPAMSLRGRASFNFGPNFTHKAPSIGRRSFASWPGMPDGKVRADVPIIGDENNVGIYKEIQIHGEVSLKNNVQRLVANRKYLDRSKELGVEQRSWGYFIDNLGPAEGSYGRTGADKGMPIFTQRTGGHQLLFDAGKKIWKVIHPDRPNEIISQAPAKDGQIDPPRDGWEVPEESRGYDVGLSDSDCKKLMGLLAKDGKVCRHRGSVNFNEEFGKLSSEKQADEAWEACVFVVQSKLLKDLLDSREQGIPNGQVVETLHPYPAKHHSWTKSIKFENAKKLEVTFADKCRTYDSCAYMSICSGSLSKSSAGVGARVQVKALSSAASIHGTLTGRLEGGKWSVQIDHDEAEISSEFRNWLEEAPGRSSRVVVAQDLKQAEAYYEDGFKVGDEIYGFALDGAWKACLRFRV